MTNIFSDSDTIEFGGPSSRENHDKKEIAFNEKKNSRAGSPVFSSSVDAPRGKHDDFEDLSSVTTSPSYEDSFSQKSSHRASQDSSSLLMSATPRDVSLVRLLMSMKRSFLPRDEENTLRQVILSEPDVSDPMILVKYDEDVILIGSGFHQITSAGKSYDAFPDMRLPYSERENLCAWVLLDDGLEPKQIFPLLKALKFPPIYTTRNIIAKFREFLKASSDLENCRFFELFSDNANSRDIGGIECLKADYQGGSYLALQINKIILAYKHMPVEGSVKSHAEYLLAVQDNSWKLNDQTVLTGEVWQFGESSPKKHTMRFTFDVFYFDHESVGVRAGYIFSDRSLLSEGGVLVFTLREDPRIRAISGHIFIDSRGFLHPHEILPIHKEILKAIRINYEQIITKNPRIDRGELAQILRKEITKYAYILTDRTPLVMPIILD